ncbi:MAG TPA: M28 family peptidase [Gemmatimonadaceae bacterium]
MQHRSVLGLVMLAACAGSPTVRGPAPMLLPISAEQLRRDLSVFASDSFAGRETGAPSATRAARFLVDRITSLGLEPAGDSFYVQRVPLIKDSFGPGTRFTVTQGQSTSPLALGPDVAPLLDVGPGTPPPRRSGEGDLVFAGYGMSTMGRNDFRVITETGRVIVMVHGAPPNVTDSAARRRLESSEEFSERFVRALQLRPAAIIILMTPRTRDLYEQQLPSILRGVSSPPGDQTTSDSQRPLPMILIGMARAGSLLLPANWPNDDAPQPLVGRRFFGRVEMRHEPFTAYNVVGIVRGTDPRLNKTYVAFGAHLDHIGIQSGMSPDSIANGADDDGSGSVTLLAIAKSMMAARPRRSILFVWHTGEEKGLLGSAYFTDHPAVPIDSIVTQINADMIGRRGGPSASFDSRVSGASAVDRLYVVGPNAAPNNQSKVAGAILDTVNARQLRPLRLDHEMDSATHPDKIYERSDHFNYARKGIPILFFTTGLHEDYHKVSDEPQKIDYEKMARVGSLLLELGTTIANREARPR